MLMSTERNRAANYNQVTHRFKKRRSGFSSGERFPRNGVGISVTSAWFCHLVSLTSVSVITFFCSHVPVFLKTRLGVGGGGQGLRHQPKRESRCGSACEPEDKYKVVTLFDSRASIRQQENNNNNMRATKNEAPPQHLDTCHRLICFCEDLVSFLVASLACR